MTDDRPRNPFPVYKYPPSPNGVIYDNNPIVGWKWFDETGEATERTFATQEGALKDLVKYVHWLNHGPTRWQKVWWPIRYTLWPKVLEFLRA